VFAIGTLVVYGGEGVCRVEKIGPSSISCADREREYYTLAPVYHSGQVITPVDTRVLMRPIMTAQEADAFIATLQALPAEQTEHLSQRAVREHYQAVVTSYDCSRLASFLKALCTKRAAALRSGKKVSQLDERYSKRAEDHLYGELAAALGIEKGAVCAYIRRSCPEWLAD
jgi:CarD family transcriptional regulator